MTRQDIVAKRERVKVQLARTHSALDMARQQVAFDKATLEEHESNVYRCEARIEDLHQRTAHLLDELLAIDTLPHEAVQ